MCKSHDQVLEVIKGRGTLQLNWPRLASLVYLTIMIRYKAAKVDWPFITRRLNSRDRSSKSFWPATDDYDAFLIAVSDQ